MHSIAVTGAEDAVLAVASHFDKEADAFATRMNETAQKLGLMHSRFVSPVDHANNRMSAHDIARLTMEIKSVFLRPTNGFPRKNSSLQHIAFETAICYFGEVQALTAS